MPIATSNFLIPNATFFVELLAFLIVLAVVGKYVLPFLKAALDERIGKIKGELEAADEAKADAEAADDERRSTLEDARTHAREIVAQAARTAEQVTADGQSRGQEEYERLVQNAEGEIRLARQRAVDEAAARLGELVMDVVEQVIGREVDAEAHRALIDEAVEALRADTDAGGAAAAGAGSRA
jgi:F-type H+-transporting ATPase subunit b